MASRTRVFRSWGCCLVFGILPEIIKGVFFMSTVSDTFGSLVFDDRVMRATLPADSYQSLKKTIDEGVSLDIRVADAVAVAMNM